MRRLVVVMLCVLLAACKVTEPAKTAYYPAPAAMPEGAAKRSNFMAEAYKSCQDKYVSKLITTEVEFADCVHKPLSEKFGGMVNAYNAFYASHIAAAKKMDAKEISYRDYEIEVSRNLEIFMTTIYGIMEETDAPDASAKQVSI